MEMCAETVRADTVTGLRHVGIPYLYQSKDLQHMEIPYLYQPTDLQHPFALPYLLATVSDLVDMGPTNLHPSPAQASNPLTLL